MSKPNKYTPHQGKRETERRARQELRKRERALDELAAETRRLELD